MKIFYFVRTKLHEYPPCLTQLFYLKDLGHDVTVYYGDCAEVTRLHLEAHGVRCVDLNIRRSRNRKIGKLQSYLQYRTTALRILKKKYRDGDLVWFGTADSGFSLLGKLKSYRFVLTVLELYDRNRFYRKGVEAIIHDAAAVIACEDTRAQIMKSWWNLQQRPFVMPNKPYAHPRQRNMVGTTETTRRMIDAIRGKKVLLYQGIISADRDLGCIARALADMDSDITLALMGREFYNGVEKVRQIYQNTVYLGMAPAPTHLEVTSHATVGIANYDDSSLNNLFCAPNKIYEYTGFGIP
ncbi:MAG: hypothetical protein II993_01290, partial [Anaerotignum sp.]|nr:hypothetical protein [Anaerotignum sp.]